ncbi:MAG: c-type cytochrome [Pirellulales bacterium]|nr:c-type cytochrome [Pirellulales bacterium]
MSNLHAPRNLFRALAFLACGAALVGCGQSDAARFRLNMDGRDPTFASYEVQADEAKTSEESKQFREDRKVAIANEKVRQQLVVDLLTAGFGTPDEPFAPSDLGLDIARLRRAAGPVASYQSGQQHGLYRKHCAHCHGISGDGAGPTALFLNPYPRDYRPGVFKFTSTGPGMKPTRADLERTIREGLAGTAMPSFATLPQFEVDALIEYVIYLSIRGETETLLNAAFEGEELEPIDLKADAAKQQEQATALAERLKSEAADRASLWTAAVDTIVVPNQEAIPPFLPAEGTAEWQASVERGRVLFRDSKTANCIKCHGLTALGDGGGEELFDDWNKAKPANTKPEIALWELPKQELRPRNLRLGIYRGGRRPADLYRRIHVGIKGTPMPAAGNVLTQPGQIWDIVNYVLSLPYEASGEAKPTQPSVAQAP